MLLRHADLLGEGVAGDQGQDDPGQPERGADHGQAQDASTHGWHHRRDDQQDGRQRQHHDRKMHHERMQRKVAYGGERTGLQGNLRVHVSTVREKDDASLKLSDSVE
ncbi:hypothetical protein OVA15_01165 [Kocuria sp. SL71]|nr:hypothetical protein [Kocuria sp. SL71]MCY1683036.1 hypothetical protein [Kocuria sp. SL71]